MAKEAPWFKFFTGEWANGSITLEDYAVQGVFINACCYYWSNEGDVKEKTLRKKIRSNDEIDILIEEEIIKVDGEHITIKFLDVQMVEREEKSKQASEAGKKSAMTRAAKRQQALSDRSTTVKSSFNEKSTNKSKSKKENKNKKLDKEREKEKPPFPDDILLNDKYIEFLNFRREIKKPVAKASIEANKKKLMKLADENSDTAIQIIEQSIANGWQGFFNLKIDNNGGKRDEQTFQDKFFKGSTPGVY
jgi:hypothetical protein